MYTKIDANQDRYDNDDNDMHEDLLDPINFSPFGNIKKKHDGRGGCLDSLKAEGVEKETQSVGKPSSPHADSPDDSQYDQCATGDARM